MHDFFATRLNGVGEMPCKLKICSATVSARRREAITACRQGYFPYVGLVFAWISAFIWEKFKYQ